MLVKVYGSRSPRLKALVRDAVSFAANKLIDKRIRDTLDIAIKFDPDLMRDQGSLAECEWIDTNYKARVFEITLNGGSEVFLQVVSVMHEMVHVKQYSRGELFQSLKDCKRHKWQKQWVDDSKIGYYDLPWEIEAHGREKGMMIEWINKTELLSQIEKEKWRAKFTH